MSTSSTRRVLVAMASMGIASAMAHTLQGEPAEQPPAPYEPGRRARPRGGSPAERLMQRSRDRARRAR